MSHSVEYIWTHLFMVLDPHAQSVNQNGDHDPSSKILAIHNLPEGVTHQPPEVDNAGSSFAQPPALLLGLSAVPPVPGMEILADLINSITVRVAWVLVALGDPA